MWLSNAQDAPIKLHTTMCTLPRLTVADKSLVGKRGVQVRIRSKVPKAAQKIAGIFVGITKMTL